MCVLVRVGTGRVSGGSGPRNRGGTLCGNHSFSMEESSYSIEESFFSIEGPLSFIFNNKNKIKTK